MLLAEVGYDQQSHDAGVKRIRKGKRSINKVIVALVELYQLLYNVDAYSINCGMCEDFAADVCSLVKGAEQFWGDELINEDDDPDEYAYHNIVRYQGRYYDSEHPNGVDDFREIAAFHN